MKKKWKPDVAILLTDHMSSRTQAEARNTLSGRLFPYFLLYSQCLPFLPIIKEQILALHEEERSSII
jgi:hypothetical protein